jgi:Tol biopolymer transport system component
MMLALAPVLLTVIAALTALAQREPVLKQIDVPHHYYYREMYLPQLTTGPSSVAWMPDSKSVVYSMGGTLWRQALDSTIAQQLTDGPGYHYQPDVSPDGEWIIFSEYYNDALELRALHVASGRIQQLTTGGAVNLDPRFSPDGRRIVFVSTEFNRRFHIFLADFADGKLANIRRLTGETKAAQPRYYYSLYDHEISPAWSPDGREILFISNRGHQHGSGGIWRMPVEPGADAVEIHREETTWRARPDWSRDGKNIAYSSYLGRPWNQLWATTADAGGYPFPLTYGDFDNTAPRYSPDGKRIAFISNRTGNTSLWILDTLGGASRELRVTERRYQQPHRRVHIRVLDPQGHPTPARVSVTGPDGRSYAPADAWMHGDEWFVRAERPFEAHYFHSSGISELEVPAGKYEFEVMKGFENQIERRTVEVTAPSSAADPPVILIFVLRPLTLSGLSTSTHQWLPGDAHIHMNYGGHYRNTPENLARQAEAEGLRVVHNLIVNKEVRIPDVEYFRGADLDPASTARALILHSQEFHTSAWGHLGLLGLRNNLLIPDYADYPRTGAASPYPSNNVVSDLARAQGALVGYVHPFDAPAPDPYNDARVSYQFPADVAHGKVDYFEVMGFSDHLITSDVWYRLLNLGYRIPAAAGTDAMMNYASLRGPLGLVRVYAHVPKTPLTSKAARQETMRDWLASLRAGRTFVSNGPLLAFRLGEKQIGDELSLPGGSHNVAFTASVRSIVPLDHAQIICNGKIVEELPLAADRTSADARGSLTLDRSGWCLLRAYAERAAHPILDLYPFASTSPIYITVDGAPAHSPNDAAFFVKWLDRILEFARAHPGWASPAQRDSVLAYLASARAIFAEDAEGLVHVHGTLTDINDARVPDVELVFVSEGEKTRQEVSTAPDGTYSVRLWPGNYALEVTRAGFCKIKRELTLQKVDSKKQDFTLQVCPIINPIVLSDEPPSP